MPFNHIDPQWLADIEGAVEYVSLIDANDKILYVNHAKTLPDTISGKSVYDFVEPAYHDLLRQAVAASSGERHASALQFVRTKRARHTFAL